MAERAERRYAEGRTRLPSEPARREKQLVRMAMAAGAAGLACAMDGRADVAAEWFRRSAASYRESWDGAPPGSWGRPVGALKARILAADAAGATSDAEWVVGLGAREETSPIARYAFVLAALVLGRDEAAAQVAMGLGTEDGFPADVARALHALARGDGSAYAEGVRAVLDSFETRHSYLEDVPVADTVLVLEALAEPRGLAVSLSSPLLPVTR